MKKLLRKFEISDADNKTTESLMENAMQIVLPRSFNSKLAQVDEYRTNYGSVLFC